MASIKQTIAFQESAIFVFGSWVCVADDARSFHCHLILTTEKKVSASTIRPTVDELIKNLGEIQLFDIVGGQECEFGHHSNSTQAQIGLLESDSNPSSSSDSSNHPPRFPIGCPNSATFIGR
ncbi:unnamed protein product [Urochloa humidicola]